MSDEHDRDDARASDPPAPGDPTPGSPGDDRGAPAGAGADHGPPPAAPATRRPLVERIGMAAIAAFLAVLFGALGAAAWISGEPFLAVMAIVGALMTAWVGLLTLVRG
jgi:hypothetical protein